MLSLKPRSRKKEINCRNLILRYVLVYDDDESGGAGDDGYE